MTLKDLIIDTSEIASASRSGIYVNEGNDNPVYIQSIQIDGGIGRGIYIKSENVWVEDCIITDVKYGIYLESSRCHIFDNFVSGFNCSSDVCGIYLNYAYYNTISGNIIDNLFCNGSITNIHGIYLFYSDYNSFSCNTVSNITGNITIFSRVTGFHVFASNNNLFTGNIIKNISDIYRGAYGIRLAGSQRNKITDNDISCISGNNSYTYGIELYNSNDTIIMGNHIYNITCMNDDSYGIDLIKTQFNTITGNTLANMDQGICGTPDVFYTVIMGNTLYNIVAMDIMPTWGTGCVIEHNSFLP